MSRFSTETRNRLAKIANVGMLASLVSSLVTFAPMMPVQAASIALKSFSTTLSRPVFSSTSNVTFTYKLNSAIVVGNGDPCTQTPRAGGCADLLLTLGSGSSTNLVWNTPVIGDITFSTLPLNAIASTTVTRISDSQIKLYLDCTDACTFPADTTGTITITNNPITTPVSPGFATGVYATYPTTLTVTDPTNVATMTSIVAVGVGVTVSATVDPSLTFYVTGVAASTPFFTSDSTSIDTTLNPDECNFASLSPGVSKVCAFDLHIATNASNGYSIYVVQDQDMTFNGNSIKKFNNGVRVDDAAATTWSSPSTVAYAHLGYSSNDLDIFPGSGGAAIWAGIPDVAAAGAAPVVSGLVASNPAPESAVHTYAIKIESAATLPQGTGYTHHEYFMVVGNF